MVVDVLFGYNPLLLQSLHSAIGLLNDWCPYLEIHRMNVQCIITEGRGLLLVLLNASLVDECVCVCI